MSYFTLTYQALTELGNYLYFGWVDEILLAVDDLDRLEGTEIPYSQVQLVIEGKHIWVGLQKFDRYEIP